MSLSLFQIQKNTAAAAHARDNLTIIRNNRHYAKVCCICDKVIMHGDEDFVSFDDLKKDVTRQVLVKGPITDLTDTAVKKIHKYYIPCCLPARSAEYKIVKDLYLSPRSYRVTVASHHGFGCCLSCKRNIKGLSRQKSPLLKPPTYAISNGLMFGPVPNELSDLTATELALISIARVDKHVFSFQGGAHVQMKGWHTMYANDIVNINRTVNWCSEHLSGEDNVENDVDSDGEEDEEHLEEQPSQRKRFATICVILSGPFTQEQYNIVKQKTEVNFERVKKALRWLKRNNRLYSDYDLSDDIAEPIFLEQVEEVPSQNSNVERTMEFCALFPDSSNPDSQNGGFFTRKGFKEVTLERMLTQSKEREAKLISKPTTNILRDYEGDNLLKAFPLQFPYGIGSRKRNEPEKFHNGVEFYRHLSFISRAEFQKGDFVCVLHNMYERTAMRFSATFRRRTNDFNNYVDLTNEAISEAAERFNNGVNGSSLADNFLRAIIAATKEMAHTNAAAKEARQKLYAYCARFGVPSMMVTVTPVDEYNFRIRVLSNPSGEKNPPKEDASNENIRIFLLKCSDTRRDYPGYCAIDYENVMKIFLQLFLGWDENTHTYVTGAGIFGTVEAWSIVTEEQGRKTLHGHSLVWLKEWPELNDKLSSSEENVRINAIPKLVEFANRIMTTHVIARDDLNFKRPCSEKCAMHSNARMGQHMSHCSEQDVRNLRCTIGTTSLGQRSIMKCDVCKNVFTSEDLAIAKIADAFGEENIKNEDGSIPTANYGLWTRNLRLSNAFVRMERHIMEALLPQPGLNRLLQLTYSIDEKTRLSIAVTKNLHKSDHVKQCFKSQKKPECRMKLPNRCSESTTVHFSDKPSNWYSWTGKKRERFLYFLEPKRSAADLFGNIHSAPISEVFGCNTNVVACVDGGSPMYLTNYTSKNTQDEDNAAISEAGRHIIKNMKKSLAAHGQLFGEDLDQTIGNMTQEERKQRGLRTLMAAVLQSTKAHVCSAPLGAFLVRNKSRFKFSHDFVFPNIFMFEKEAGMDYTLSSSREGTAFIRSSVADYRHRPAELENLCLYDFLTHYCVADRCNASLDWCGDHPSGNFRKVKQRKVPVVVRMNHFDFPSTSDFDNMDIRTCEIGENRTAAHFVMEEYAKKVCIVFVRFRNLNTDLKINGSFHQKLQQVFREGRFKEEHERILQNMQDVRNSLNAGRVSDPLEKSTCFKYATEFGMFDTGTDDDDYDTSNLMNDLMEENASFENVCYPKYRTGDGTFSFSTNITRELGKNKCGNEGLITPQVPADVECVKSFANENAGDENDRTEPMHLDDTVLPSVLNELIVQVRDRVVDIDDNGVEKNVPDPTGTLQNLIEYSEAMFENDKEQRHSFCTAAAAFCLRIHLEASKSKTGLTRADLTRLEAKRKELAKRLRHDQLIAFLNGPGGTGKSHVVSAIVRYCKKLCENLQINFDKRTIVVTAMSGSAAVSINGETAHMACCINTKGPIPIAEIEKWKHAYLLIIDEISFASKAFLEHLNKCLGQLLQNVNSKFGGIHILFVGDMSQLDPVGQKAMYRENDVPMWFEWVDTFFELKTNHRFKNDPRWGEILSRFRDEGPTIEDVNIINTRVIGSPTGPTASDIPSDATYATSSNLDRVAINDGIFAQHLVATHSKNPQVDPPKHTICIKASNLKWKENGKSSQLNDISKDILYACCGEAHVFSGTLKKNSNNGLPSPSRKKMYSPLLKVYYDRPMMLTENVDVERGLANGSMCNVKEVLLRNGVTYENLEKIQIDGYYVWCADVSQVREIKLELQEGDKRLISLKPESISAFVEFPVPIYGTVNKRTERWFRKMSMTQFQLNEANARTVHKLQGKSLKYVVVNCFKDFGHWAYVAMSRVKILDGLFLRSPIDFSRCTGMKHQVRQFMDKMKQKKIDDNYLFV
jgi:hypothetical protein